MFRTLHAFWCWSVIPFSIFPQSSCECVGMGNDCVATVCQCIQCEPGVGRRTASRQVRPHFRRAYLPLQNVTGHCLQSILFLPPTDEIAVITFLPPIDEIAVITFLPSIDEIAVIMFLPLINEIAVIMSLPSINKIAVGCKTADHLMAPIVLGWRRGIHDHLPAPLQNQRTSVCFCLFFTIVWAVHWRRTASIDTHGTMLCPARTKKNMYDAKTVCLVVWRWWWHGPVLSPVLAPAGFIMFSELTNTSQVSVSVWLASSWFGGLDWLWCNQMWQRWKNGGKTSTWWWTG